jgi:hemerythrin-like domain-containing protein
MNFFRGPVDSGLAGSSSGQQQGNSFVSGKKPPMSQAPNLLNDDGTASMATAIMLSHHAFRRDLARFERALERVKQGDTSRVEALQGEWKTFHATLHSHHQAEDTGMFPGLAAAHESVRATVTKLEADHRRIDPLLERGDAAFAALPEADPATAVVRELIELLTPHLATEEAEIVPCMREMKQFPPPPDDAAADMYAQGFSWAMQGIAPDVLEKLHAMLPQALLERLPAARKAFDERCERVWGSAKAGAARTPIPDPLR